MSSLKQVSTKTALTLASMVAITAASMAAAADYTLTWWTIDGGGVMHSSGGVYELSGTIGQPEAGTHRGGSLTVTGGFWFAYRPGDCNDDGSVDLSDYVDFAACMTGPDQGPVEPPCVCFDLEGDGDVDLKDAGSFQSWFSG